MKLQENFRADLFYTARTGMLSRGLWAQLLLIRHSMHGDTHFVEGLMSILQLMGKRAPNMHLPLACSRLSLKASGLVVTPQMCAAVHNEVLEFMDSDAATTRFIVPETPLPKLPDGWRRCHHKSPA